MSPVKGIMRGHVPGPHKQYGLAAPSKRTGMGSSGRRNAC